MIEATLDRERPLPVVRPESSLEQEDFPELSSIAGYQRVLRSRRVAICITRFCSSISMRRTGKIIRYFMPRSSESSSQVATRR